MVIDKRKVQLFQKESVLADAEVDTATVQTEVEVLQSDNMSLAVITKLHLIDDPEFGGSSKKGLIGTLKGLVGTFVAFVTRAAPERPPTEFERESKCTPQFQRAPHCGPARTHLCHEPRIYLPRSG
jgi:succinoglycan biosynthesis transport protein ExoP